MYLMCRVSSFQVFLSLTLSMVRNSQMTMLELDAWE